MVSCIKRTCWAVPWSLSKRAYIYYRYIYKLLFAVEYLYLILYTIHTRYYVCNSRYDVYSMYILYSIHAIHITYDTVYMLYDTYYMIYLLSSSMI